MPGALAFFTVALFFGCGKASDTPERYTRTDVAMGTVIQESIYASEKGEEAAGEIFSLIESLERDTLSRRLETAEIYKVNHRSSLDGAAQGGAAAEETVDKVMISDSLGALLENCVEMWKDSEGAFDVTLEPVIRLWDIDGWAGGTREGVFEVPDHQKILDALDDCGSGKLVLERSPSGEGYVLSLPQGMELDLGAVGKGAALDEVRSWLERQENISGAVICAGGSVLVYGQKPDQSLFQVAITDPADTSSVIGLLSLEGTWCVSTSGDYERYVEADGVRYHHILDPATGYPAAGGVQSVTILSDSGFLSDALSTACFVSGPEEGMKLAEKYHAEALFVDEEGNLIMTQGMERYFTPSEK